jgi:UDP-N-acetylglucosamine 4,6-dehydratase
LLSSGSNFLPITSFEMTRFLLSLKQATELIDWAYSYENSHGKIAVPKIKSLRMIDVANTLIKSHPTKEEIKLKEIGVRPGEKLHEELISSEEWAKTEEHENFLIGNEINTNHSKKSFNSHDSLMDSSEAFNFLKENGVV